MIPLIRRHAAHWRYWQLQDSLHRLPQSRSRTRRRLRPAAEAPRTGGGAGRSGAPAPAPVPTVTKETIDNPYGLEALWGGDFVAKGTLIILVIMSMGSWYIIITKVYEQSKLMRQARDGREDVLEGAVGAARAPRR